MIVGRRATAIYIGSFVVICGKFRWSFRLRKVEAAGIEATPRKRQDGKYRAEQHLQVGAGYGNATCNTFCNRFTLQDHGGSSEFLAILTMKKEVR
jgi:hypothetical protein